MNINKFDIICDEIKDKVLTEEQAKEQEKATQLANLKDIVRQHLSDYLGFNIIDLLTGTDAIVYGGAVRDSIAGLEIHDIDIMVLPDSCRTIAERLKAREFDAFNYASADIMNMYSGPDHIINEPLTFIKTNSTTKPTVVQLIRPVVDRIDPQPRTTAAPRLIHSSNANELVKKLIADVDISACGVAYDYIIWHKSNEAIDDVISEGYDQLYETISGAFNDCKQHTFRVFPNHRLYRKDRIENRIAKLLDRGWKQQTEEEVLKEEQRRKQQLVRGIGFGDAQTTLEDLWRADDGDNAERERIMYRGLLR